MSSKTFYSLKIGETILIDNDDELNIPFVVSSIDRSDPDKYVFGLNDGTSTMVISGLLTLRVEVTSLFNKTFERMKTL